MYDKSSYRNGCPSSLFKSKNCISGSNKIPEYARDFKKEYLFIWGINKELENFIYLIDSEGKKFSSLKADRFKRYFDRFVKARENGRLKDISHLRLKENDVEFIDKLKLDLEDYSDYFYVVDEEYNHLVNNNENDKIKYDEFYESFEKFKSKLKPDYPTYFEIYNRFLNIDGYDSDEFGHYISSQSESDSD